MAVVQSAAASSHTSTTTPETTTPETFGRDGHTDTGRAGSMTETTDSAVRAAPFGPRKNTRPHHRSTSPAIAWMMMPRSVVFDSAFSRAIAIACVSTDSGTVGAETVLGRLRM